MTLNGAVKTITKAKIDDFKEKTKMTSGEVVDAMAELFFGDEVIELKQISDPFGKVYLDNQDPINTEE